MAHPETAALPRVLILSAPSGAGKTSLLRALLQRMPQLTFSISATTRAPRENEQDGVDYYFLSEEDFRQRLAEGAFIETEEVYPGRFYGTLRSEVQRIADAGHCPLFEVDVVGGLALKAIFQEKALALFIAPPSVAVLGQRLRSRGTESEADIQARMAKAEQELGYQERFDDVLVNDDFAHTLEALEQRVRAFFEQSPARP